MNIDGNKLAQLSIDSSDAPESNSKPKYLLLGVAGVVAIAVGLSSYVLWGHTQESTDKVLASQPVQNSKPLESSASTVVAMQEPEYNQQQSDISASGYVVAKKKTTVSSSVAGVVSHVHISEGQQVVKGQLLAELNNDAAIVRVESSQGDVETARINLVEAKLQLAKSELDLNRLEQLIQKSLVSDAEYKQAKLNAQIKSNQVDSAKQRLKLASSNLELAKIDLSHKEIRAPFDGVVTEINAQPGEIVSPISGGGGHIRTGICTIVDLNSLVVEVDVSEQHLEHINRKHRASIQLDAYSTLKYEGAVDYIVPVIDKLKGSIKVRIAHTNFDERVLPGMGVQVWIEKSENTLARQEIQR